jgi:hypothetical protein
MVSYQQKVTYVKTTSDLYLCYTFIIHRAVENYNTDNEMSSGNNLLYHPLSYVLFVLLY